ncbi:MAG: fused MFS/spermidine synthase [Verrucomicrobiota bacterium]
MKTSRVSFAVLTILVLIGLAIFLASSLPGGPERRFGEIIHETRSDFSHIRVREKGPIRSLLFVDPDGSEHCQSSVNVQNPSEHQLGYTKSMLASLFFHYPQSRVLIVGLGGGGMVQFFNFVFPTMMVEAVEIDPVVADIAWEYFKTRPGPQVRIYIEDAFVFFEESLPPYDVIYMDAFLQPAAESGLEEKTLRLKTVEFLTQLQTHLTPDGLVAFNIIPAQDSAADNLAAIEEAFASTFSFDVPGTGNRVVIACKSEQEITPELLAERAERLDETLALDFSFEEIAKSLRTQ